MALHRVPPMSLHALCFCDATVLRCLELISRRVIVSFLRAYTCVTQMWHDMLQRAKPSLCVVRRRYFATDEKLLNAHDELKERLVPYMGKALSVREAVVSSDTRYDAALLPWVRYSCQGSAEGNSDVLEPTALTVCPSEMSRRVPHCLIHERLVCSLRTVACESDSHCMRHLCTSRHIFIQHVALIEPPSVQDCFVLQQS